MTTFAIRALGLSPTKQDHASRDECKSAKEEAVNPFHFVSSGNIGKPQAHE